MINKIKISKNFILKEFECKDGNHEVRIDSKLLEKLQKLRDLINKPIYIVSGYRTKEYNKKIGGAKNSQHIYGKAADIKVKGMSIKELYNLADKVGFDGIGTYKTFLHVDVRGYKSRW